jgi:hypothetical protein
LEGATTSCLRSPRTLRTSRTPSSLSFRNKHRSLPLRQLPKSGRPRFVNQLRLKRPSQLLPATTRHQLWPRRRPRLAPRPRPQVPQLLRRNRRPTATTTSPQPLRRCELLHRHRLPPLRERVPRPRLCPQLGASLRPARFLPPLVVPQKRPDRSAA